MRLLAILQSPRYRALPTGGTLEQSSDQYDESEDLNLEGSQETTQTKRSRAIIHLLWLLWLNLALFLISSTMFIMLAAQPLYHTTTSDQEWNFYLKHVSMPC